MAETIRIEQSQPTSSLPTSSDATTHLSTRLALRPYQEESLAEVDKAYKNGRNRLLVSLPTGTGKTLIFSHLVAKSEGRSLVIAHREELIEQAFDKIRMVLPNADLGIVKAEQNQASSQIIVASIQTLAREHRLSQLGSFSTIIIDEAHHAAAESYIKVLKSLRCFEKQNPPLTLGVTATPERGDKVGLDNVFQEIVYHRNLLEMISEQYLSDLTWQSVELDVDLDEVGTRGEDFVESDLIKALSETNLPEQILSAFKEYASNRKTIVFVPGVALAHQTAQLLKQHNIKAESIDGKLSSEERKAILSRLKTGQTQVIVNCLILTEGFDESSLECVIFGRPTKSKSFYLQMLGRGTRLHPGKENCLIIDLVGITQKHKLITLPNLFGLPAEKLKKDSVLSVHQEEINLEAKRQALAQQEQEAQRAASKAFEKQAPKTQPRVINFNWLKLSDTRYALSVGKATIFLIKQANQDKWAVILNELDKTKTTLIGKDLPLEYAQGVAQDYVRSIRAIALIDTNAHWRSQEPTDKQISLIKQLGIKASTDINKGQASDLISIFFANQDLANFSIDDFILQQTQQVNEVNKVDEVSTPKINNQPSRELNTTTNSTYNQNNNLKPKEEKVLPFKQNPSTPKVQENKVVKYIPDFAKICLSQSVEQLKLYDTYTLHNYTEKGQIANKANKWQIEALLKVKDYINSFLDQEIGFILSGKEALGKTHLAIGLLRCLTLDYKATTFFCDCDALLKRANSLTYPKALEEMTNLIDKSDIVLLDNLSLRMGNVNHNRFFSNIVNYCINTYKKLIITTKHLSYSTSPYEHQDNSDPAIHWVPTSRSLATDFA